MKPAARDGEQGFTLLELLLAVVLLVTLMAMLAGGVGLVSHRVDRSSATLDRAGTVALVQKYLRGALGAAVPVALVTDANTGTATVDFDGSVTDLAFVGPAPASVPLGGLMKLDLRFAAGEQGRPGALVLDWQPYNGSAGDPGAGDANRGTRPLLTGIRNAAFAYYDPGAADRPAGWLDDWHGQAALPGLVRLSAVFNDGDAMPELIVALRLANPVVTGPAPGTP